MLRSRGPLSLILQTRRQGGTSSFLIFPALSCHSAKSTRLTLPSAHYNISSHPRRCQSFSISRSSRPRASTPASPVFWSSATFSLRSDLSPSEDCFNLQSSKFFPACQTSSICASPTRPFDPWAPITS